MTQLVFIHGPGAGGCGDGFAHQLSHFSGSLAPTLPGHLEGEPCSSVERYTDWLRGWLWAQGHKQDLVLAGFTLGACIALEYALDYPDEVSAIALMTVAMRPKQRPPGTYDMRLKAVEDPAVYQQWIDFQMRAMTHVDPELREHLMECHRRVGPISQYRDLVTIDQFDVRDRIGDLKAPLLLIRGIDDPTNPPEYEAEIHAAVPGSRYVKLAGAGHFPMAEQPAAVNQAIEELIAGL